MNRIRFWLTTTAVFLAAGSANAQSLSAFTLMQLEDAATPRPNYTRQAPQYFSPAPPFPVHELQALALAQRACATQDCCESTWYMQALHHGMAAWQRLRACCETTQAATCGKDKDSVCRDGAGCPLEFSRTPTTVQTGSLMLGAGVNSSSGMVGHIVLNCGSDQPGCCGIKPFVQMTCPLGYTSGKPTPPCCCAKACTCCEMCKAKSASNVQLPPPAFVPMPAPAFAPMAAPAFAPMPGIVQPMYRVPPVPVGPNYAFPGPVAAPGVPLPPPPAGARAVVGLPASTQSAPVAHLVTPDFDAHCQRISHRDGHIVLEGNVMLLCKKHAQPIRVEGQRVILNLKDGTFTVETASQPPMATYRIHAINTPDQVVDVVMPVPMRRVIELPVAPR